MAGPPVSSTRVCHSHWFSCGAAYVRTDSDVITLTKISRIDRLPYFLTCGAHDAETNILNKYLQGCQGRMLIAVRKEKGSKGKDPGKANTTFSKEPAQIRRKASQWAIQKRH